MSDEHEHDFNTPIDVFEDDGMTHHRENSCGACGELEPKAKKEEPARKAEEHKPAGRK
jgi:hypothetical protein